MANSFDSDSPQFGTAKYSDQRGGDRCETCGQPIGGEYYRVNNAMICVNCAEQAKSQLPKDSGGAYGRALVFGAGGALLGLILYSTVGIVTGLMIGYVSLAVGFIVGKAMMMGSRGIGGRRYQITAAALTYAAVSLSAIPIAIAQFAKAQDSAAPAAQVQSQAANGPSAQTDKQDPADKQDPSATTEEDEATNEPPMSLGATLGYLFLIGLASPILELQEPMYGLIGLIILAVGIQIAWKMTAGSAVDILGPFQNTPSSPPPIG